METAILPKNEDVFVCVNFFDSFSHLFFVLFLFITFTAGSLNL